MRQLKTSCDWTDSTRKIEALLAKGWIQRDDRKFLAVTDKAKDNLQDLTEISVRYLRDVEAALAARGRG